MIKVTPEQLDATAARLRSGSEQIDSLLAQLRSQVEELRAGGWQGMASDQFGASMQNWDQGARQVREALAAIGGAVSQSANNYRQTEQAVASTFGGS